MPSADREEIVLVAAAVVVVVVVGVEAVEELRDPDQR